MSSAIEAIGGVGRADPLQRLTQSLMLDVMSQALQQTSNALQGLANLLGGNLQNASNQLQGGGGEPDDGLGLDGGPSGIDGASPMQGNGSNPMQSMQGLLQMLVPLLQMLEQLLKQGSGQGEGESPMQGSPDSQNLGQALDNLPGQAPAEAGLPHQGGGGGGGTGGAPQAPGVSPAAGPQGPAAAAPAAPAAAPTPPSPAPSPAPSPSASGASSVTPVAPPPSSGGPDLSPQEVAKTYKTEIERASQASGIPPGALAGMIWQESKGKADTPGGGLMQLGDNEFQKYGGGNINNPADNIMAGAMYMKDLVRQFGDVPTAMRAYNSGPNGVDRGNLHATPAGTGDPTYVDKVMGAGEASGLPTS